MIKKVEKQENERVIDYGEVTKKIIDVFTNINNAFEEWHGDLDKFYERLGGLEDIVRDWSFDELGQWSGIAKDDDNVGALLYYTVHVCWAVTHPDADESIHVVEMAECYFNASNAIIAFMSIIG